jgi:hypothetical protein
MQLDGGGGPCYLSMGNVHGLSSNWRFQVGGAVL